MKKVGKYFENGFGVEKNIEEAKKYFLLAEGGVQEFVSRSGFKLKVGTEVRTKMNGDKKSLRKKGSFLGIQKPQSSIGKKDTFVRESIFCNRFIHPAV